MMIKASLAFSVIIASMFLSGCGGGGGGGNPLGNGSTGGTSTGGSTTGGGTTSGATTGGTTAGSTTSGGDTTGGGTTGGSTAISPFIGTYSGTYTYQSPSVGTGAVTLNVAAPADPSNSDFGDITGTWTEAAFGGVCNLSGHAVSTGTWNSPDAHQGQFVFNLNSSITENGAGGGTISLNGLVFSADHKHLTGTLSVGMNKADVVLDKQ